MSTTNTTTRRGTAAWNDRLAEGAKNLTRAERRALAACAKGGGRKALRAFERALYRAGSSRVATAKGPRSFRLDGGTQSRTTIDEALVAEYVALIKGGATMDAVACVAALAHLLDLRRHLRGVVDGAAGGSA